VYPILWQSHFIFIPTWHVLFLLATLSSYAYLRFLTLKFYPFLIRDTHLIFIWAYIGALMGGRLLSHLIEDETFQWSQLLNFDSLTFYGGFLGAVALGSFFIFIKKLNWYILWDVMIPPLFLGLSIGRIGCFLNGDDFGVPVAISSLGQSPWWSVSFPNHDNPIPRFPIQIVESLTALALACILGLFFNSLRKIRLGLTGTLGVLIYSILRIFLENYRDDYRGWFLNRSLSTSQGISLLIILSVVFYVLFYGIKNIYHLYKNRGLY
jgi:phosphatidylglycerol:prolipoprotein diacylglycerol transferase